MVDKGAQVVRRSIVLFIAAAFVVCAPSPALAWMNGPEPDGFGTHDWILYEALRIAQPSWVDTQAALLVTDDPDSVYGEADRPNHSYLASGAYRGAPDVVATLYEQAIDAHRRGDFLAASRHLGVLSHYYADMAVPFHTRLGPQDLALHALYEAEVDRLLSEPGANSHWVNPWRRAPILDVRASTVDIALASRAMYPTLELHYRMGAMNAMTELITRTMLNRAVNDLADIIQTIPTGLGVSDRLTVSTSVSHRYPAAARTIRATARCYDSSGLPVEAAKIEFRWNYADGSDSVHTYTDAAGEAKVAADPARLKVGRRVSVSAHQVRTTPGASASTVIASSAGSTWFVPTDEIGYVRTTVSDAYPARGTVVKAETTVLSRDGKPMAELPVTFNWHYRTKTVTVQAKTDTRGIARSSGNIGAATLGRRVPVEASVTGGGTTRTAKSSFIPSLDIRTMESSVSSSTPVHGTTVTARTRCLDGDGLPVAGATVTFTWRLRTKTLRNTAVTDAMGVARAKRDIGRATANYPVYVTSTAPTRNTIRTSMAWFVPRKPPPPAPPAPSTPPTSTP